MNSTAIPAGPQDPHTAGYGVIPPDREGEIAVWLDRCEQELIHPERILDRLRRSGWSAPQAAIATAQYRRRFNEHALGYSALFVATGVAGLAAGTAGHVLAAGIDHPVNRNALATALTVFTVAVPFAVWAHRWAAMVDRSDPVAVWSGPRRKLAQILLWACGIVGIGRLAAYAGQLIGVLVGATWARGISATTGAVNVSITIAIALPLATWAYGFLHRFDHEDPTIPTRHERAGRASGDSPAAA